MTTETDSIVAFDGIVGSSSVKATVGRDGSISITCTCNGSTGTISADSSGEYTLSPEGFFTAKDDCRCGGSDHIITDPEGNIVLSIGKWLGSMCAGITMKTAEGRLLTRRQDDFINNRDGNLTIHSGIELADGTLTAKTETKHIEE